MDEPDVVNELIYKYINMFIALVITKKSQDIISNKSSLS